MCSMRYLFTISHVPGKSLVIADALLRALLPDVASYSYVLKTKNSMQRYRR